MVHLASISTINSSSFNTHINDAQAPVDSEGTLHTLHILAVNFNNSIYMYINIHIILFVHGMVCVVYAFAVYACMCVCESVFFVCEGVCVCVWEIR